MTVRVPRFGALLLVASLSGLGAAAPLGAAQAQQPNNNFFGNLFKPPGQVGQGEGAAGVAAGDDPGGVTVRIDRLENQLRQMTGQLEQLQYRNQQLEAQLKRFQEEVDYRLPGGASGQGGAAGQGAPAGGARPGPAGVPGAGMPPGAAVPPGKRSDVFDPAAQPGAPGAPRPLGTTAPSGPIDAGQSGAPMDLGGISGGAPAGGTQVATLPPSNTPKDMYDLAYGYVLRQDYEQAGLAFERFLKQYPSDRSAPDAYYWLGESDYQRQLYKEAAQNFLKVSTDYPNAVKAPDALLRLGQALAAIGETDAACATYNAIGNKYPRASPTVRQGVEREQKRAHC